MDIFSAYTGLIIWAFSILIMGRLILMRDRLARTEFSRLRRKMVLGGGQGGGGGVEIFRKKHILCYFFNKKLVD